MASTNTRRPAKSPVRNRTPSKSATGLARIQVDMFDVGLGASLLIQMRLASGDVVRVLADGGMGPDYPPEGVHARMPAAVEAFHGENRSQIDLIVGTHYDSDHLRGLVPIAEDPGLSIKEVWLPPLKDDSEAIESSEFLVDKFYRDDDGQQLLDYLRRKRAEIEEIHRLERDVVSALAEQHLGTEQAPLPFYKESSDPGVFITMLRDVAIHSVDGLESFFRLHIEDCEARALAGSTHDLTTYDSSRQTLRDLASLKHYPGYYRYERSKQEDAIRQFISSDTERASALPAVLAEVRKSTASGAITASNLHKVVRALAVRQDKPIVACRPIEDGMPRRYVWTSTKRRFIERAAGGDAEVTLQLLGPNQSLVDKHREKLPIGLYAYALMEATRIRLEGITPSNQLSYMFTLEMSGQRLLISGDAGCYGFKHGDAYYPRLLEKLATLHVVQVAHHAGRNYDFYNSLLEAGFARQRPAAILLISHAAHDKTRPSQRFAEFVAQCRRAKDEVRLLFTGEPLGAKVDDFDELICAIPPGSERARSGDVRIAYTEGARGMWQVLKHVVSRA